MKYLISSLLVIGFIGIAIFGFMLFDIEMNHANTGCIASMIYGTACPMNITDFDLHHVFVLQSLSRILVPPSPNSLLFLISLLLISISISLFHKNLSNQKFKFPLRRLRNLELDSSYSERKIRSWLSLFELSPALQ